MSRESEKKARKRRQRRQKAWQSDQFPPLRSISFSKSDTIHIVDSEGVIYLKSPLRQGDSIFVESGPGPNQARVRIQGSANGVDYEDLPPIYSSGSLPPFGFPDEDY